MDFTPAEFPTTGVSEKEFIDKMIALAKAGEDDRPRPSAVGRKRAVKHWPLAPLGRAFCLPEIGWKRMP